MRFLSQKSCQSFLPVPKPSRLALRSACSSSETAAAQSIALFLRFLRTPPQFPFHADDHRYRGRLESTRRDDSSPRWPKCALQSQATAQELLLDLEQDFHRAPVPETCAPATQGCESLSRFHSKYETRRAR